MNLACSLCNGVMTQEEGQQFSAEVPQIGKTLVFKVCPSCQDKARYHKLHVCLGCKSTAWVQSTQPTPGGVRYHIKFHCNNCITTNIRGAFAHEAHGTGY
ncbi:MAG: hypothetical protein SWH78_10945 [Thermodesulfobacteriota bacterium]|nr:hypothetical protein [Thermodesulfobacteriota bacterium]